jgi:cytochrome P450
MRYASAMIIRLAMSDFTFSDGTFIPKGSSLAVSGRAMNQDEVIFPTLHLSSV